MSIKPHIEGEFVTKIEVNGLVIPALGDGMPLAELSDIIQSINKISEYFSFSDLISTEDELDEWSLSEIFDFLDDRNRRQILFFSILNDNEDVERSDIIQQMADELNLPDFTGRQLAGSLAGIGIRTNSLGKERLYESDWREEDDGWKSYYFLVQKYRSAIKTWLERN